VIGEVNLAGAALLGLERQRVSGQPFEQYLAPDSRAAFRELCRSLGPGEGRGTRELRLLQRGHGPRDIILEGAVAEARPGQGPGWRLAVTDISERKEAEVKLHQWNAELEQRVMARTAELRAANRELEAFCYSVSHDLRAPLRTIDGFSKALLDDCQDRLGASGQDHLQRVRAGCQRMGRLIEDLLNLSRLARAPMRREPTDLSALALKVAEELQQSAPERAARFRIAGGLAAVGDAALLRVALWNLLENAWKFTAKRAETVIEVGVTTQPSPHDARPSSVFYVRDNGAGFNMAHADKLFGAFQRLHSAAEYPGTGIGLATVQRVISRHGGEIWAEAVLGLGATFYFTLGREGGAISLK
jgi:PAS domain S-box-containing protein